MAAAITCVLVLVALAVWAFLPDRHPDGTPVTGVYDFPADSLYAPHGHHTALDTQAVTGDRR